MNIGVGDQVRCVSSNFIGFAEDTVFDVIGIDAKFRVEGEEMSMANPTAEIKCSESPDSFRVAISTLAPVKTLQECVEAMSAFEEGTWF